MHSRTTPLSSPSSSVPCSGFAAQEITETKSSPQASGRSRPRRRRNPSICPSHQDETIFISSGRIRIEVKDGETFELTAGSMASLSEGAMTRWTVLEPTIEYFVYS